MDLTRREKTEKGTEKIFKEILAKKSSNLMIKQYKKPSHFHIG